MTKKPKTKPRKASRTNDRKPVDATAPPTIVMDWQIDRTVIFGLPPSLKYMEARARWLKDETQKLARPDYSKLERPKK